MKVKVESEKVGLKLNIQKTKIMASGPITSWQTVGKTMETVTDFHFGGSKITPDGDCSVQFSRSVMSDSLRPHELQHAKPPCPSPTPRVHSNHVHKVSDAIQPSHLLSSPSPPAPNPSQNQGLFQ